MDRPIALVTGASRGIGRAVALDLGRTHHVLVGGRTAAAVAPVVAALPSAEPFVADLATDPLPALPDRLDVLVHSAGVDSSGRVADTDRAEWERVLGVNVVAVADLTRAALPALRAAQGLVVAVNSGAGLTASPGGAVYAASKFALRAFTDALREEERGAGVRVSSVHPGRTDSDMQQEKVAGEGDEYDTRYYLDPASVAAVVRTVVDLPAGGTVETVSVRPTRIRGR
ncbi:SDR family oxidoreductase [Amnibacterium setariae]|uniref:SDR family oxidoreductase n=1 Tax=Amnibacterium setariae TaxID=2306585 RepID=A0A3A1U2Z0_9MICO|nr:SDR family oxidoreductase [Amnibacterium setariae]RIX30670.1 SDR family oxidoreductase [Amnibacterium setariae]